MTVQVLTGRGKGWRRGLPGVALGTYALLLWSSAPRWPDDWDGIGFVEAVSDFDMARFHPHPPGYPVYVALLRLAAALARSPMKACILVAVASALVAVAFVWAAACKAGERAGWMAAILVATAPGVWRACSGVGSEAPALACAAACGWGLLVSSSGRGCGPGVEGDRDAHWPGQVGANGWAGATVLGLGAGLGLGIRLSWGPLYVAALALAPRGQRLRAWATAAASCLAWVAPFIAWVGPRRLARLYAAHFAGHSQRWGGSIVTDPGSVRLFWFARDLLVDGLGVGSDMLGLLTGALVAVASMRGLLSWWAAGWRGGARTIALIAPYAIWIGLGQNLRDQPRHALPMVLLLAAGLALPVAVTRRAWPVVGALAIAASVRTAANVHARCTTPPAGQQLVELARSQRSPKRLVVFGGASVRFFESTELASNARVSGSLGDVLMELTRVDRLPARVWVTSELGGLNEPESTLEPVARLCRLPGIDRRMPCLNVFEWKLPFLPAE